MEPKKIVEQVECDVNRAVQVVMGSTSALVDELKQCHVVIVQLREVNAEHEKKIEELKNYQVGAVKNESFLIDKLNELRDHNATLLKTDASCLSEKEKKTKKLKKTVSKK